MISLSSVFKSSSEDIPSRLIGIRPINTKIEKEEPADPRLAEYENIQKELSNAKEQLKSTKLEIDQIVAKTQHDIATEKEMWLKEKEQYKEEAYQEGYLTGLQAGKQQGYDEYKKIIAEAKKVVQMAKDDYQTRIYQSEESILELGLKVASKILRVEVDLNDSYLQLVKAALLEVKEQPSIQLYVNVEDYHGLMEYKDELYNIVRGKAELSVFPDSELTRGSCVIESPFGKIDASIDSQLQELRDHLFNLTKEADSEHTRIP